MFKYLFPTTLIGIAILGYFFLVNPMFNEMQSQREQIISYNEALDNSQKLENARDQLTQKYNSFSPNDLNRLEKMLPDRVDNIRLILEIEKLALPYGMVLKDVKYDASTPDTGLSDVGALPGDEFGASVGGVGTFSLDNYHTINLSFSTQGTYNNFLNFIKDIENNLRIVDISSVDFTAGGVPGLDPDIPEAYKYDIKIKTYWLK